MQFQDYYAALGVERDATLDQIKRAFRKLARRYHPDVSKEPDAETRFKEVAEAYKALKDPERRAAYDELARDRRRGENFAPPPDWDSGFAFRGGAHDDPGEDFSAFFSSLFAKAGAAGATGRNSAHHQPGFRAESAADGQDRHARIVIDLEDSYRGANRTISLRVPTLGADGRTVLAERQLAVQIPKGVRTGQHLRLAGQGEAGSAGRPAGDLFLEITLKPHAHFQVDGADVYLDLPVAPWEAALGADVVVPTPDGTVELSIPPGSVAGRRLRLRGKGIPGNPPGQFYVRLGIGLPPCDSAAQKAAYADLARAFPDYAPRSALAA